MARDRRISDQTLYTWRRQERIDPRLDPGSELGRTCRADGRSASYQGARGRGGYPSACRPALEGEDRPKRRFAAIQVTAAEGLPLQAACRTLMVSEAGYDDWRSRPPSARSMRHAWLTDVIAGVHRGSRETYGARRVHAELTMGLGVSVGHCAVQMLMAAGRNPGPNRRPAVAGGQGIEAIQAQMINHQMEQHGVYWAGSRPST